MQNLVRTKIFKLNEHIKTNLMWFKNVIVHNLKTVKTEEFKVFKFSKTS